MHDFEEKMERNWVFQQNDSKIGIIVLTKILIYMHVQETYFICSNESNNKRAKDSWNGSKTVGNPKK